MQAEGDSRSQESAETLSGKTFKLQIGGRSGERGSAKAPHNFAAERGSNATVFIGDVEPALRQRSCRIKKPGKSPCQTAAGSGGTGIAHGARCRRLEQTLNPGGAISV